MKQRLHLLFTPTKITIKYLIYHILNTKLSKMSLNVFYTSIHGFLHHQLFCPSLNTTFRPTHEKHETSKGLSGTCSKEDKRHYLASQNNFEQDHFSLKKLIRSNLNMVNQLIPKVSRKEALERVSFLVTFGRNKFPEIVRIIVKTQAKLQTNDQNPTSPSLPLPPSPTTYLTRFDSSLKPVIQMKDAARH